MTDDRGRDRTLRPTGRRNLALLAALLLAAALAGCSASAPRPSVATETPAQARPTPSRSVPPNAVLLPVHPVGDPVVIASGLDAPWSILRLPAGTLISERDTALVREFLPDGSLRDAAKVPGVRPGGEGGLLGLAFLADAAAPGGTGWVYAYFTAADDNEIVRMPLSGTPGGLGLGSAEPVLSGIPKAGNHDGGRLGFGPDGLLYATAGDAGNTANAQDLGSLGGKILRMTPTGQVPAGNPFGTLIYSFGHRNPQGIAWDSRGRLWASEFGQNTWDELNLIVPGGNYGWPVVEGAAGNPDYRDPAEQWRTSEASPSGLAIVNDTLFLAALRGERIWRIDPSTGETSAWFVNSFGRLRDVVSGPDGTLWFVSNNTDGRGDPSPGDDRLYQVRVAP
ncbi:PQQ-dependent sugar dehydrogenase [Cryobacterium mannosilyticum]|uniref:PQQ-dependent sugar dehydrogenase n=1 Tax=Cryobacterium mannosilyticum TaxID=1259190 RepID=A0A4R8WDP3_9MICO|nr:PQQ-dependent sugar dehydrogenase [Cryobacterium mannosilyticum]TFC04630.1 PQQ-dependent sugar dehydrogenase [Cryobacterium mannosilyticum]